MKTLKLGEILESQVSGYWGAELGSSDRDVLVVRNGDVLATGSIRWDEVPLRAFSFKEADKAGLRQGDLVLTTSGYCGQVAYVEQEPRQEACASNFVRRLRVNSNIADSRFMFHQMNTEAFRSSLAPFIRGTTMKNLSVKEALARVELVVPPLTEQRRIAAILDKAEEVRAKRRAALETLETLSQAIFIEMFGDPVTNPMGWSVSPLGDLASQVTDGEHATPERSESGVKLLSARNVRDGFLDTSRVDYVTSEVYSHLKKRCDPVVNDILISCSGTIGRVVRLTEAQPLALVRSVALVRPIPASVHPIFIEHLLRTAEIRRWMEQRANSSAQANLFQNQIRSIPILTPDLEKQLEFVRRVSAIPALSSQFESAMFEQDNLFSSLRQKAFQGAL